MTSCVACIYFHAARAVRHACDPHGRTPQWVRYFHKLDQPVAANVQDTSLRQFLAGWCVWKDVSNATDEAFIGALRLAGSTLR
jgi:hypothetical protein